MRKLVLGQRLDGLVDALAEELKQKAVLPLEQQVVFVPPGEMRTWLGLELAKRGIVAGYRLLTVNAWVRSLGKRALPFFELASAVYGELRKGGEWEEYVGGKEARRIELAVHLAELFERYGETAPELFEGKGKGWQRELLGSVFGRLRAPVQVLAEAEAPKRPLYCFGIDHLPECLWKFLCRAEELSVYLFSPCIHFWEDACSDWEKRGLLKRAKEGQWRELEGYWEEAPALLANWGRLGRKTLKMLGALEVEENYTQCKAALHLQKVQRSLLEFEKGEEWERDGSLKVIQAGSSRFREVEVLCDGIVELAEKGILFSEMGVLAADLGVYAPLMELLFTQRGIPYRMGGVKVKSPFLQSVEKLLEVLGGKEEWEELFESASFVKKMGWDREALEKVRQWIPVALKEGVEALWSALVMLDPGQSLRIEMGDGELLEQFVEVFEALATKRIKKTKTFGEWALFFEEVVEQFLVCDEEIAEEFFLRVIKELRQAQEWGTFPLEWMVKCFQRPIFSEIHPNQLHGVRVAPLEEGNVTAFRALFLVGMDEENFPRSRVGSSLDLIPEESFAERDRYLSLRALFSAEEILRVSFHHQKEKGMAHVVEELLQFAKISVDCVLDRVGSQEKKVAKKSIPFRGFPQEERVVSVQDLAMLARHPWKFYLRKAMGIWLEQEESLSLKKAILLRETLTEPVEEVLKRGNLPEGLVGEALALEVREKAAEWKEWIKGDLFSALFLESCREKRQINSARVELPCLQIAGVRIVGEVRHLSEEALVIPGEDSFSALLKVWPEWLCAAVGLGVRQVLCLKTGKRREIEEPEKWLKQFLEYFFAAEKALSPLLPEWADALLRGGKKKALRFKDPVADWVFARIPSEFGGEWEELCCEVFGGLTALFPRKSHAKI